MAKLAAISGWKCVDKLNHGTRTIKAAHYFYLGKGWGGGVLWPVSLPSMFNTELTFKNEMEPFIQLNTICMVLYLKPKTFHKSA